MAGNAGEPAMTASSSRAQPPQGTTGRRWPLRGSRPTWIRRPYTRRAGRRSKAARFLCQSTYHESLKFCLSVLTMDKSCISPALMVHSSSPSMTVRIRSKDRQFFFHGPFLVKVIIVSHPIPHRSMSFLLQSRRLRPRTEVEFSRAKLS